MRLLAPLFLLLPLPAWADTFEVPSRVAAVTLYPEGAQILRRVEFQAGAGSHTVVVPDLPAGLDPISLRVMVPEGVAVGSMRLASGRLPGTADLTPPEVLAAEARVRSLEDTLRTGEQNAQLLMLQAEAAEARSQFLRSFGKDGTTPVSGPEALRAMADTIGAEILDARETALKAAFAADAASRALEDDRKALDRARQDLAALSANTATEILTLTLNVSEAGPVSLDLMSFIADAGWIPVYDLSLERGEADELTVDRGVMVWQHSEEDWKGVQLTLSTARPTGGNAATAVGPWLRRIFDQDSYYKRGGSYESAAAPPAMAAEEPVILYDLGGAEALLVGTNVTYSYPGAVDLRSSVDQLRLELDSLTLTPTVLAAATPLYDSTAFVLAVTRNTTPEVLLPGPATLWLDGEMVGQTQLPLVAAGDETEIGFGPIDGLLLKRIVPQRTSGDTGIIGRTTQSEEEVRIEVKNLTGETWSVRLIDRVPYSEQEELSIRFTASPAPDVTDYEGKRGVLLWGFDLAPAEARTVQLAWQMRWPAGQFVE